MKNIIALTLGVVILAFSAGCRQSAANTSNNANSPVAATSDSEPVPVNTKLFTSEAGGFSIATPGEMRETTQDVPTAAGNIKISLYQTTLGENAFVAGYSDFPAAVLKQTSTDKMLDGARDGAARNVNGTVVSDTKITLDGSPGREIVIHGKAPSGQEATAKVRYYLVKNRLYQIMVVTPKGNGGAAGTDDFLQSFKLQNQ